MAVMNSRRGPTPLAIAVGDMSFFRDGRALCADYDAELWFDGDNEHAKRICARCPLQPGCGQWGHEHHEWGVWAGFGSGQRRLGVHADHGRAAA